jgi:hypothetical protein
MMKRSGLHPALRFFISIALVSLLVFAYFAYRWYTRSGGRTAQVIPVLRGRAAPPEWKMTAGRICKNAPFHMPTDGFIGFIWDDSFRPGHRHQGLDIFGLEKPGVVPVYAAYPGYLTRLPDWKSTVIIRIPRDPLRPGQQIWAYYTHMAESDGRSYVADAFPPGTTEVFVEQGTLLGYQGNYSGDPNNPTGVHLHFSIVRDDGNGNFLNELEIKNTLDPSPYLGMQLNAKQNPDQVPTCKTDV